jgi:copper resistance protein D
LDDPLICVRAIHFAATLTAAGVVFFIVLVAAPAFRQVGANSTVPIIVRATFKWIAWLGLLLTVLSGAAWFVLVAQSMSDRVLADVFSEGIPWTVLSDTGFGHVWLARFALACLLAGLFVPFLSAQGGRSMWLKIVAGAAAAGLAGALAFAGHAVGASGSEGLIHPAADALHLVAAAAWVGTLLPLALLLRAAGHEAASVDIARAATLRFSTLGIVCVGALILTGTINTLYLAGSIAALTETDYGRLLVIKIALFFGMVVIATINRLWLTPRLVQDANAAARDVLRRLRRNTLVEVAAGALIIAIVAALGVSPPGHMMEMRSHAHHHSH